MPCSACEERRRLALKRLREAKKIVRPSNLKEKLKRLKSR